MDTKYLSEKKINLYDRKFIQIERKMHKLKDTQKEILDEILQNDLYKFEDLNIVKVIIDSSCSMASVELNDECIFLGNYWDFHPYCHGGRHRLLSLISNFSSPKKFADTLCEYMQMKRLKYKVQHVTGKYEEIGGYFINLKSK